MSSIEKLMQMVGTEIGVSEWVPVTQERVDQFAEATGDHQWIHTDPDRAAAGPFGVTIAHGLLTLSIAEAAMVDMGLPGDAEPRMLINYGADRVRFLAPVKVGSRVRTRASVGSVGEASGGARVSLRLTVDIENEDKPAMVADVVTLAYW